MVRMVRLVEFAILSYFDSLSLVMSCQIVVEFKSQPIKLIFGIQLKFRIAYKNFHSQNGFVTAWHPMVKVGDQAGQDENHWNS